MKPQSRTALLDEYGELSRRVAEFKPTVDRHKQVKTEILLWCEDIPADKSTIFEGRRYSVRVGECKEEREIINKFKCFSLLRKLLGLKAAIERITIPLGKAVDAVIPEEQHKLFLVKRPTGPRDVVAVAKASEVASRVA